MARVRKALIGAWGPLLFLLSFCVILFRDVLFRGMLLAGGDLNYQYYIWKDFFVRSIREGVFPFWNPYPFCGTPFFHDPQTATLYPPDLIHFALPMPWSFGFSFCLHVFWSGVGFYWLAGRFCTERPARLYSALLYMGSGFILSRLFEGEPTVTQAYSWIPVCFHFGIRLYEQPSPRRMGLLALGVAMLVLSGHPHLPFLAAHLFVGWLVFEAAHRVRAGAKWTSALAPVAWLVAGGALGLLAVAVQVGPFVEFAGFSATRAGGASYDFAAEGSLSPRLLLLLAFPYLFRGPSKDTFWASPSPFMEAASYLSTFGLLLALCALLLPRKRFVWLWSSAAALGLLLALGSHTPLHRLFYELVPGWDRFRNPGRALLLTTMGLALLAGGAVDQLLRLDTTQAARALRRMAFPVVVYLVALIFTAILVQAYQDRILNLFAKSASERAFLEIGESAPGFTPDQFLGRFEGITRALWIGAGLVGLFTVTLGLWARFPRQGRGFAQGILLVTAADLLIAAHPFLRIRTADEWRKEYCPESPAIRAVQREEFQGGRLLVTDMGLHWMRQELHRELFPNAPMLFGVRTVRGYSPSILKHFNEFINLAQNRPPETPPGGFLFLGDPSQFDRLALRVMGVRALLHYEPAPPPFKPVERFDTGIILYENPEALPRCFPARKAENRWGLEPVEGPHGATRVLSSSPNRIEVETEWESAALLVFSETWFPGWTATLAGQRLTPERAFHAFQAIPVPAGRNRVTWEFQPTNWTLFQALSAMGLAGILLCLWMGERKGPRPEMGPRVEADSEQTLP
ncbi:MAG: hypothetical protein GHCLOJNM_03756 [bacterium]|nr:hypothetical protein [bacterium]